MAVRIRVDPVEKVTAASLRADLSRPEQRRAAAVFARRGIDAAKETNRAILGRVPLHTVTVDGRVGALLESVNPDGGSIIAEFEIVVDVLRWIAETLLDRSPVVSGAYKRGHALFADGVEVDVGATIPAADEYVFANLVPYARKIEIGKTQAGRAFVIQAPNQIYERTATDARRRFGNVADIRFSYRGAHGRVAANRQPAIIVKARSR